MRKSHSDPISTNPAIENELKHVVNALAYCDRREALIQDSQRLGEVFSELANSGNLVHVEAGREDLELQVRLSLANIRTKYLASLQVIAENCSDAGLIEIANLVDAKNQTYLSSTLESPELREALVAYSKSQYFNALSTQRAIEKSFEPGEDPLHSSLPTNAALKTAMEIVNSVGYRVEVVGSQMRVQSGSGTVVQLQDFQDIDHVLEALNSQDKNHQYGNASNFVVVLKSGILSVKRSLEVYEGWRQKGNHITYS